MTQSLYAIRDLKADAFAAPFSMPNEMVATRAVIDALNDPDTLLARHPEDYQFWYLGDYTESSGLIMSNPRLIGNLSSLAVQLNKQKE